MPHLCQLCSVELTDAQVFAQFYFTYKLCDECAVQAGCKPPIVYPVSAGIYAKPLVKDKQEGSKI